MNALHERNRVMSLDVVPNAQHRAQLSLATDIWIQELAQAAGVATIGAALVAVGGYGRGELAPGSDIDLLLIVDPNTPASRVAEVAEAIWYPIWDSGISLDHSVRTVASARTLAAAELKVMLGLLDARTIFGDETKTVALVSAVLGDWRAFAPKRLAELHEWVTTRTQRSGELAHLLEPDLKESFGGLRDATILRAIAASWITDVDRSSIHVPVEFLLDVRDALHRVTGRKSDRLVLQEQQAVAELMNFPSADDLLRAVSKSARAIAFVCDQTWHRALRNSKPTASSRFLKRTPDSIANQRRPLAEGVVLQDDEATLARDADPLQDPSLLLRAAAAAAQAGVRLSPHTAQRLATVAGDLPKPWTAQNLDSFISLLGAGKHLLPVWEALDQHDVFSRLIPEWAQVRSAPQHNPVHRYTVDRHLVETAIAAGAFTRNVRRPDLLLVAALLHDIGKPHPGEHCAVGEALVLEIAPKLGFNNDDVLALAKLTRLHLFLPELATTRDISDPTTISNVLAEVESHEFLELLHALTIADARAAGPAASSNWRLRLIDELVANCKLRLSGTASMNAPELANLLATFSPDREVELRSNTVDGVTTLTIKTGDATGLLATIAAVLSVHKLNVRAANTQTVGDVVISEWLVTPTFGTLPDPSLLEQDIRLAIAGTFDAVARLQKRKLELVGSDYQAPPPTVSLLGEASARASVIEVRAHDVPGLLNQIGSLISHFGLDITAAKVATIGSEAIDVFYVTTATGEQISAEVFAQLAQEIVQALSA